MTELEQALRDLAYLRATLSDISGAEKVAEKSLQQGEAYRIWTLWRDARKAKEYDEQTQYEKVRALAVQAYVATGIKQPASGASVAVNKHVAYDPDEAEQWIRDNAPNLLIPDWERFTKGVKDGMLRNAPATITEHPTAKIAKDLSDYLHKSSMVIEYDQPLELTEYEYGAPDSLGSQ